jgi:hypothetical protein
MVAYDEARRIAANIAKLPDLVGKYLGTAAHTGRLILAHRFLIFAV